MRYIAFVTLALLVACDKEDKKSKPQGSGGGKPATPTPPAGDVRPPTKDDLAVYTKDVAGSGKLKATIETSMGTFHCDLYEDKSPMTVANFVGLATGKHAWRNPQGGAVEKGKPFYNGLTFHRVIPGFMVQGGCPLGNGTSGPGYEFDDETDNGIAVEEGMLAMANLGPATNGSQFFIMESRAEWLDGKHTVFGRCAEVDLVKRITLVDKVCPTCNVDNPRRDKPKTHITIKQITFSRG
jgi:peptidyl-prolyl cis-trans isomerase A (cyclophilin A)